MKTVITYALVACSLAFIVPKLIPSDESENTSFSTSRSDSSERRSDTNRGEDCQYDPDLNIEIGSCASRSEDDSDEDDSESEYESSDETDEEEDGPRRVYVDRDERGHFNIVARMNGRRVSVMLDTGASSVAINEDTAQRLGFHLNQNDFVHNANTANGVVKFARVTINDIRIDGIVVDDVEAAVLPDDALSGTLLGMSFLNRLTRFEASDGRLKMVQ